MSGGSAAAVSLASLMSVGSFLSLCVVGAVLRQADILTPPTTKSVSKLLVKLALPCLIVSKVLSSINVAQVLSYWPLVATFCFNTAVGSLLGISISLLVTTRYLGRSTRTPKALVRVIQMACMFSSNGYTPLALLAGMLPVLSSGGAGSAFDEGSVDRAVLYVALYILPLHVIMWITGRRYMMHEDHVAALEALSGHQRCKEGQAEVAGSELGEMEVNGASLEQPEEVVEVLEGDTGGGWRDRVRQGAGCLQSWVPMPTLAVLVSVVVISIPGAQPFLVHTATPGRIPFDVVDRIGVITVPLAMFVLGANLSRGPKFHFLGFVDVLMVSMAQLVVQPLLGISFVLVLDYLHLLPADPVFKVVLMLESITPTNTNPVVMLEESDYALGDVAEDVSSVMFWEYLLSAITMTVWMVHILNIAV